MRPGFLGGDAAIQQVEVLEEHRHLESEASLEEVVTRYGKSLTTPARSAQLIIKRFLDIVVGSVALCVLALPLALLIAVIRLESEGPAIIRQHRLGIHGRVFTMYKLRSMRWNSKTEFNADGSTRVLVGDPRLTRIGRFIRRIGIDELPQLINVLRGEMSLIGPRPDQDFHLRLYRGGDFRKLAFAPGITSMAQAEGRNAIPWRDRIAVEIRYIEHFNLLLDLEIAWKTVRIVLSGIGSFNTHD